MGYEISVDIDKIPESDADALRKQVATEIRKTVMLLNMQLQKAAEYGMVVELDTHTIAPIGGGRHAIVNLKIYKEL